MEVVDVQTRLGWPTWVGVVVDDFEAERRFYRDTLGFRETEASEGWAQFDVGGNMFELMPRGAGAPYEARGYQVSFAVEDIEAARAQLVEAGVTPLSEVEGGPETPDRWCSFRDPEGNVFGITQRLR
jgi:predicted enzyme related to lactoylglutathione lyase